MKLVEEITKNDRLNALAAYLNVDANEYFDMDNYFNDNVFKSKQFDEEYLVLTEKEAYDRAVEEIKSIYDDLGLESFTPNFQQWIIDNAIGDAWFVDAFDEMNQGYVDDIESESDDVYENRLISELVDENILTEEDFDNWGEDHPTLKDSVNLDEKKAEYVEKLAPTDPIKEYKDEFGNDTFKKAVDQAGIDLDMVAKEAIAQDGVAHFIALYDGDELDLGNGLYGYRIN